MKITPLFILLFLSINKVYACSSIAPFMLKEYEGMSIGEANLAASDIVFRGYLIQAETTARKRGEDGGVIKYKYLVLEGFKGSMSVGDVIDVYQNRTYCSFKHRIDDEHLVYLNKGENGKHRYSMAQSGPLHDRIIDMKKPEDAEFYAELVAAGMANDYSERSPLLDGEPKIYVYSAEKQLDKVRASSLNK